MGPQILRSLALDIGLAPDLQIGMYGRFRPATIRDNVDGL
jgi:hypothetical protein